jgi:hypothetical protein
MLIYRTIATHPGCTKYNGRKVTRSPVLSADDLTILLVAGSLILSGFTSFITQTAAITNFTASGGFFMDFTNVISVGFSVFSAAIASISTYKVQLKLCA